MRGKHTRSNLVLICLTCHKAIHDDEFAASLEGWIAWSDPEVGEVLQRTVRDQQRPAWAVSPALPEHGGHQEGERLCIYVNWCLQAS